MMKKSLNSYSKVLVTSFILICSNIFSETTSLQQSNGTMVKSFMSGATIFPSEPITVQQVFRPSNSKEKKLGENLEMMPNVKSPDKLTTNTSYFPYLKHINGSGSSEIHEENGKIFNAFTKISEFATQYGKRSLRSLPYHYPSRIGLPHIPPYIDQNRRYYGGNSYRYERDPMTVSSSLWGGKWLNKLKTKTSMLMNHGDKQHQMNMLMNEGTAEEPYTSGSFLSGWGSHSKTKVNKSAVGLLGFLSLLSLIQNVLNQTTPTGRRRRSTGKEKDTYFESDLNDYEGGVTWEELRPIKDASIKVNQFLLPMMNAVNQDQNEDCSLQLICSENQSLAKTLKLTGSELDTLLNNELKKLFKNIGSRLKNRDGDKTRLK